jgi:hypothetical protein
MRSKNQTDFYALKNAEKRLDASYRIGLEVYVQQKYNTVI